MIYTLKKKLDATVQSEIQEQAPSASITGFQWVSGDPEVTCDNELTDAEKAKLLSYFGGGNYLEAVAS